jgi:hypothetical protein
VSADTLRKAAALMRERADFPSPSFWSAAFIEGAFAAHEHVDIDAVGVPDTISHAAEHIASWHPAVALAVADLLDNEASLIEGAASHPDLHMPLNSARCDLLLATARAYLGSDA